MQHNHESDTLVKANAPFILMQKKTKIEKIKILDIRFSSSQPVFGGTTEISLQLKAKGKRGKRNKKQTLVGYHCHLQTKL